jgi:hypothetical protein
MTTETTSVPTTKKTLMKTNRTNEKRSTMRSASLKPIRSLKKSSGIKPNPLKLR